MTEPVIRSIPLHRLEPSPANVRRTEAGKGAFAELKASIAAHGLLGEPGGPRRRTRRGSRRALRRHRRRQAPRRAQRARRRGRHRGQPPRPCRIVANGAADGEISLAENVVRVAMHPADQVQAFGALALAGATVADIAARFGVSERIVEQRLRLGHAAPELLDAYRENAIDLETLKAFAVTTDNRAPSGGVGAGQGPGLPAHRLADQAHAHRGPHARRRRARPLRRRGRTYEAAGGPVLRDLFADEHENGVWLEDPALLMQLAMDRLKVAADELATRWKWAEARLDVEWSDLARFGRVRPTPAEPTDEEKAEIERLHTRHDELVNMDEDAWTDELIEEAETIEPRLEEIQDAIKARAVFKPEDIAIAGCIVTVGGDGDAAGRPGAGEARGHAGRYRCHVGHAPAPPPITVAGSMTASRLPPASSPPPFPARPCRPRGPTRRPRRARRPVSASDSPTISAPSARRWSRHTSPRISGRPSTSCCSRWGARCSPPAITTMRSTSRCARPATGRRSVSTTTPSATGARARPCWPTAPRFPSTGWRSTTARSPSRR